MRHRESVRIWMAKLPLLPQAERNKGDGGVVLSTTTWQGLGKKRSNPSTTFNDDPA